jgi:FlaG/FlaF family flagellin (archaellin)
VTVHYAKSFDDDAKQARRKRNARISIISAAAAAVLVFGGVALAQMLIDSNTATASAQAGTAQQVKLTDAAFDGALYPGMSVNLTVKASNPNPFPVKLTTIVLAGDPKIDCVSKTDLAAISGPLGSATSYTLPSAVEIAPNGTETVTVKRAISMNTTAAAGCNVTVPFKLTGLGAAAGN